jgi:hypothetical protein
LSGDFQATPEFKDLAVGAIQGEIPSNILKALAFSCGIEKKRMVKWIKDPVASFIAAGAAIYFLSAAFSESESQTVIELNESDIERLTYNWRQQKNKEPSRSDLKKIVEDYVKDEIYFRESKRLGLDVDDAIIRRRLVQKLTFLTEDIARSQPVDEETLKSYFEQNKEDYRIPARFSFSHQFFSSDLREDPEADAAASLKVEREKGDPFMLRKEYKSISLERIEGLFGNEFAEAMPGLTLDPGWQGPVKSAFGWHTIKLCKKENSYVPRFSEVRQRVASDAVVALGDSATDAYYEDLRQKYKIDYPSSFLPLN